MKHPIEQMNINQEEFLKDLPQKEREFHAQLFRIGNAAYCYHSRAIELEPTEEDFNEWVEGLPEQIKSDFKNRGFEDCKGVLSFTRYVNEKNDIGMDKWMKENLSKEDYEASKPMEDK
jgi:hypothetical protein